MTSPVRQHLPASDTAAVNLAALLDHDRLHPTPLPLDLRDPAVRAIIALFVELKTNEDLDGGWNGGDTVTTVERWFSRLGIDPAQSGTAFVLDLVRRTAGTGQPSSTAQDKAGLAAAALEAYRSRTGARAGDFADPEVFAEVAGDLIADLFHLADQAGLAPEALIDTARRHHDYEVDSGTEDEAGQQAPAIDEEIDMDRVAQLVRAAGVTCVLDTSGGGCATIWAGPTREEPGYGTRSAAIAGPGMFGWGQRPSTASISDFYIGPDDNGEADAVSTRRVGARTEAQIAALIIAQARREDPTQPLSCDEIEALGLDGTARRD
ncbi:hypothetical protein [Pseudonocardia acidicola]|uniref:Uncharacterized protein n=1 Tax=Pseudonocardia acidicola TaxID=2724939 RepID=A0ABX1S4Q4_9PSEU|nr:hypothetical protein [Pseudonocardia acidicola]NMH96565.1 hypothetical protein [Pseudonocardia acidicola]